MANRYDVLSLDKHKFFREFNKTLYDAGLTKYRVSVVDDSIRTLSDSDTFLFARIAHKSKLFSIAEEYKNALSMINHMVSNGFELKGFDYGRLVNYFTPEDANSYLDFLAKLETVLNSNTYLEKENALFEINRFLNSSLITVLGLQEQFQLLLEIVLSDDKSVTSELIQNNAYYFKDDIKPLLNMLQNLDALVEYLYQFMEVYSKEDLKQIKCLKDINCHLDIKNKPKKM